MEKYEGGEGRKRFGLTLLVRLYRFRCLLLLLLEVEGGVVTLVTKFVSVLHSKCEEGEGEGERRKRRGRTEKVLLDAIVA